MPDDDLPTVLPEFQRDFAVLLHDMQSAMGLRDSAEPPADLVREAHQRTYDALEQAYRELDPQ